LSKVSLAGRGHPDSRKPVREQQIQDVLGITRIHLLLAHHRCTNGRGVSDPQFVVVSFENPLKPPCVDGRFDAHTSRAWKRCVKPFDIIILMFQAAFDNLPRTGIKRRDLLYASVKITAYNNHRSAPFLRALVSQPPSLLARREPTTLSNQLRGHVECVGKSAEKILNWEIRAALQAVGAQWSDSEP
jgi:hypothetical protein